jgi:2-oxoglutarate dehydrogenase E2 component (dihydrolipoamide succinyltransferase)
MGDTVGSMKIVTLYSETNELVKKDQLVLEGETDKVTFEITAPAAGRILLYCAVGDEVVPGQVIGRVLPVLKNNERI